MFEERFHETKTKMTNLENENENMKIRISQLQEKDLLAEKERKHFQEKLLSAEQVKSEQHAEIQALQLKIENILSNLSNFKQYTPTEHANTNKKPAINFGKR